MTRSFGRGLEFAELTTNEIRGIGCCMQPSPGAARRPLPGGEVKSTQLPLPMGEGWGEGRVPSSQLREAD